LIVGQAERAEELIAEVDAKFAQAREAHPEFQGATGVITSTWGYPDNYYAYGPQDARVRKKVVQNIAAIFQKSCIPLARAGNPVTIAITSNHIATSLLALIEWWLDNNLKPAPDQMGKVYKSLIIDSTVGAVNSLSAV
jgi:hypothetical protein